MQVICVSCKLAKTSNDFYRNKMKLNGLESHCKACVLKRKFKKYKQTKIISKKTKLLRLQSKVRVLDVAQCTFDERLINRPLSELSNNVLKEFVKGVLCYQDCKF